MPQASPERAMTWDAVQISGVPWGGFLTQMSANASR